MHHLNTDPDRCAFPELSDETVIAVNDFIEALYTRFQNHYFAQMHRYYHHRPAPDPCNDQIALPLDHPPF